MVRWHRSTMWGLVFAASALAPISATFGASHLWRVNEIFSNSDGTVQFIELKECCGSSSETGLNGKTVTSQTTGGVLTFNANLSGSTANKHLLLGTAAFAALPGAPTPDRIIPSNFVGINGDTIRYAPAFNYDTFTFGSGALPTNGLLSIRVTNYTTHTFTTETNSPTNYAGNSGSVVAGCVDVDGDGYGSPGNAGCPNGSALDCNDSNNAIHPGATELCNDDLDNNCNGQTDCEEVVCANVIPCVPTVSEFGVFVMALLLLTGGTVVALRRRAITRAT